jgi:hypothetical protein
MQNQPAYGVLNDGLFGFARIPVPALDEDNACEGTLTVVSYGLVGGQHDRVALACKTKSKCSDEPRREVAAVPTCENLDVVHGVRLGVDAVDLDNGHVVTVDGERIVRVARDGDNPETVPARHRS